MVRAGPVHLGGEEVRHAEALHQRGHDAGVAEHVGDPDNAAVAAVAADFAEALLAKGKRADQRFAAGQLRVGLDVERAGGFPALFLHRLLDASQQLRAAPADRFVARGLRVAEGHLRIPALQVQHVGKRVNRLELADAFGPEPDQVDVRMAGERGVKRGGVGGQLVEESRGDLAHCSGAGVVERIDRAVERGDDLPAHRRQAFDGPTEPAASGPVRVGRVRLLMQQHRDVQQHIHIVVRLPRILVAAGEVGAVEPAAALVDALSRARHPDARPAADRFDAQRPAASGQLGRQGDVRVARVDPRPGHAVDVDRRFALVVPEQVSRFGVGCLACGGHLHRPPAVLERPAPVRRCPLHRSIRQRAGFRDGRQFLGRLALRHRQWRGIDRPDQVLQPGAGLVQTRRNELDERGAWEHRADSFDKRNTGKSPGAGAWRGRQYDV